MLIFFSVMLHVLVSSGTCIEENSCTGMNSRFGPSLPYAWPFPPREGLSFWVRAAPGSEDRELRVPAQVPFLLVKFTPCDVIMVTGEQMLPSFPQNLLPWPE